MKNIAYKAITDQILAALNQGEIPWKRNWKIAFPRNGKSNRKYNGINFFILAMSGYADPRWFTFNQAKELGGKIKAGEKSKQIVFWTILQKDDANGNKKSIPLLRYFNVWNAEQIEGIELVKADEESNIDADEIIENYEGCPKIKYGFPMAAYSPKNDEVMMPSKNQFTDLNSFYHTMYHELSHSTGHKTRLNRNTVTDSVTFGNDDYSQEELIAEFSAAFLCSAAGIDNTMENSKAYIQGWAKAFKENPELIVHAAGKAQKSADWILGNRKFLED